MPRNNRVVEGLISESCKIRKRGCSTSSSTSSVVQNYRFKRAILVGKARGSRSSTPVPTWRTTASVRGGIAADSPKYAPSQYGGGSRAVSARKLAATLWGMNEVLSPRVGDEDMEKRSLRRETRVKERFGAGRSVHSGSLPPHLSDPSHSPVSERMDRSGTGSRHRRSPPTSHRHRLSDHNGGILDSISSASLMEIETRSRGQTPSGSVVGGRNRLKDVSNALTTSKELLKIVNRIWAREDQPSSSISLISALHTELERARLQVNQIIQEQRSDQTEINYLMKCFAEEKAAWRKKEHQMVDAAIQSTAAELEVERKLRRRVESLNKKLGQELAETKASLVQLAKELEHEKSAREIIESVCDDLARDISEEKVENEEHKRDSIKMYEDVEKEREMLHLAEMLHEEGAQTRLSEPKHQIERKSSVVNKLRNQLEAFMGPRKSKDKGRRSLHSSRTEDIASGLSKTRLSSRQNGITREGEVEDGEVDSAESDLHSIELNMDKINKTYSYTRRPPNDDEKKGRNSISERAPRRSTSIQRTISDGVEWGAQNAIMQRLGDDFDRERLYELEKQAQRKSSGDDMQVYKSVKGLKDQILSSSRESLKHFASPTRQWGMAWPSRDPSSTAHERPLMVPLNGSTSRLAEARGPDQTSRRSKR